MDSLTQIVLGAAVGEAIAGRKMGAKAALWGAVGGTIPDLDVFLTRFYDVFQSALVHRGFSHSLLFALIVSPILAWIFFRLYRKRYDFRTWYLLWGLAIVTHPMLDMFTNYGTQFLWPLPYRITFNSVFVIDPLYTLPFMICLLVALFTKREKRSRFRWNMAGIMWSCAYLVWGVVVKLFILSETPTYFSQSGLKTSNAMVTPMPLTSCYWLLLTEDKQHYYVGYKSLFAEFDPDNIQVIEKNHELLQGIRWKGKDLTVQIRYLTNGYYALRQSNDTLYCYDLRFGTSKELTNGKIETPIMGYGMIVEKGVVQKSFRLQRGEAMKALNFGHYFDKVIGK